MSRTKRTPGKRRIILASIARGLTVEEAAHKARVSRRMVFEWKASDEEFRRDFDAAYDSGTDVLESIARKRAIDGSDALMIFMLKTRDPARFNRKMLTISGDPDLPPVTVAAAQSQPVSPVFILPDNGRGPILVSIRELSESLESVSVAGADWGSGKVLLRRESV
jgi:hypothetical protein